MAGAPVSEFHDQLDDLDDRFTAAGMRMFEQMQRMVVAYMGGDLAVADQGGQLAADIGSACREVEDGGFLLLARHQPVGGDLRRLVALLRMCVDLDRSATLLRHFCETVRVVDPRAYPEDVRALVGELAERSAEVFGSGMDAWRRKDALAVNEVHEDDQDVNRLQRLVVESAAERSDVADERMTLGLIGRYLERIADHGVGIARDAAFVATGERLPLSPRVAG